MHPKTIVALIVALAVPALAHAQDASHWGVSGAITPQWQVPTQLERTFGGTVDIKGSDFSIGFVHGRDLGGDWGVSFVRKTLDDRSVVAKDTTSYLTQGVTLTGLEIHKYIPFVTIKQRAQIGMNIAGGFGQFKGNLEEHKGQTITIQPARDLVNISTLPLADLQAAVAVLVAPGLKVRVAGGLDFPGYNVVAVTATYLFGAR